MKKNIKHIFLCAIAILIVIGLIKKYTPDRMVDLNEISPKPKYSCTTMVETGGVYQFELYSNNIMIKKCDMKVNLDTIEFISETNTEVIPFLDFNYNTIALLSEEKTSSMVIKMESDNKGYVRADLIGVVAKDIIGEYTLTYEDRENAEENIVWDITGLVTKPDEPIQIPNSSQDLRIMCLSQDENSNVYLEIFNGNEWESYSFYILGNTIFLKQVFG